MRCPCTWNTWTYFYFTNVTTEGMPVLISIFNSISVYIGGFWLYMDKTGLLSVTTETTIRCDTGSHEPQHCSREFKTALNIIFQHWFFFFSIVNFWQNWLFYNLGNTIRYSPWSNKTCLLLGDILTGITCESTLTTRKFLQHYKTCLLRGHFRPARELNYRAQLQMCIFKSFIIKN